MNDAEYEQLRAAGYVFPSAPRVALAFSTKDRVELSKQSLAGLLGLPKAFANGHGHALTTPHFDLFWADGSTTDAAHDFMCATTQCFPKANAAHVFGNVRGGADAAIVFSLTTMLQHPNNYTHVGLVENDVLLSADWFDPCFALFSRGAADGLVVGAVSARAYEDRVLLQRDGYAVCHNLGAGMVIFIRQAAELVLKNFRTGWWSENRRTFMQLSGIDIGKYAAFRANEQWVTADWSFDRILAQNGLASLALTPSKCEMIGQIPPLSEQGLKLAVEPVKNLQNDTAFAKFAENTQKIREGHLQVVDSRGMQIHQAQDGTGIIFPHQIASLGGKYTGDWRLKWSQGFGPFAWEAGSGGRIFTALRVPVSGPCTFMVSGGEQGGRVEIEDMASGYKVTPELPPEGETTQVLNLPVPGHISWRDVRLTMLSPGTRFYGIQARDAQPLLPHVSFDHTMLPPP